MQKNFLENCLHLSNPAVLQELTQMMQLMYIKKGSLVVEVGEIQTQLHILISGVFRGFLLDADGRDITDCFAFRGGEVLVGCNAFDAPSKISMEAMTDCEVLVLPLGKVIQMLESSSDMMQSYNLHLLEALERHWEGKMLMYRCSAMQRYEWFLENYPGLIDMVSNKHIASFLGITPVTLSRIRRQLRDEARAQ